MKKNVNRSSSCLKWAGGKQWLADKVWEHYQHHQDKTFVELFAGGLGLSFAIKPEKVIANDRNFDLIRFYFHLKNNPVFNKIEMTNTEEVYYQHRDLYNELKKNGGDGGLKAELFYYLNRCGYNGLYRVNKKGGFNVPFGRYKYANANSDLTEYSKIIQDWQFVCADFQQVNFPDDAFLMVDPPYDTEFTSYTEDGFNWDDQVRLAGYLASLPNPMIVTNQATPRIVQLYTDLGFNIDYVSRPRNFRRGKDRTEEGKREIFATKNL